MVKAVLPLISLLSIFALSSAEASTVTKDFSCHVSGNNKGCVEEVKCAAGYRITAVKASCHLDRATYSNPSVDTMPWNRLKVDVEGSAKTNSKCIVDDVSISSREAKLDPSLLTSLKFGCKDIELKDANGGGDCHIKGKIQCQRFANAVRPGDNIKVMTYNIHHGGDNSANLNRIVNVIAKEGADVVALQEVDNGCQRTGRINQAMQIAKALGMKYHAFGEAYRMENNTCGYGNAIISRFPFKVIENIKLPMGTNASDVPGRYETRAALAVRVIPTWQNPSADFVFVGTHFGIYRDYDANKGAPAKVIINFVNRPENFNMPFILSGDLNVRANETVSLPAYDFSKDAVSNLFLKFGVPDSFDNKQIDYILYRSRGAYTAHSWGKSRVDEGASDHLPRTMLWKAK